MPATISDKTISAADGLALHVRIYEPEKDTAARPVVCLPGLTRTTEDFDVLAAALATDDVSPRRVIALDYRGRGRSGYDPNPANYSLPVELGDVITAMTALNAMPAVIVGTSRGGLLAMLLGAVRPDAVAGVVLNDIGPVLEPAGLMRIKSYVGKLPQPGSFEDAAKNLQTLFGEQFPKLTPADWLTSAHRTFKQEGGALVTTYDPQLAAGLAALTFDQQLPDLWKEFDALAKVPVMVIRGQLTDLLATQTLAEMHKRHPGLETIEVSDQGHAPLLAEPDIIARIAGFIRHSP